MFSRTLPGAILAAGMLGSLGSFCQREVRTPWDKADREQSPGHEGQGVKERMNE